MTVDGTAKDDVKVPEGDLGKQIHSEFDEGKDLLVTIISAMGEEQAISYVILIRDCVGILMVETVSRKLPRGVRQRLHPAVFSSPRCFPCFHFAASLTVHPHLHLCVLPVTHLVILSYPYILLVLLILRDVMFICLCRSPYQPFLFPQYGRIQSTAMLML